MQQQLNNLRTAIDNAELSFSFRDAADADRLRGLADAVQEPLDRRSQVETARAVRTVSQAVERIAATGGLQNPQELLNTVANLVSVSGPP